MEIGHLGAHRCHRAGAGGATSGTSARPEPDATRAATRDEQGLKLAKFIWLVPALVGLGGLTLIAFGQMVSVRRWSIAGVLYLFVFVLVLGLVYNYYLFIAFLVAIVAWPGSIVHLVTIRPLYLARLHTARRGAE